MEKVKLTDAEVRAMRQVLLHVYQCFKQSGGCRHNLRCHPGARALRKMLEAGLNWVNYPGDGQVFRADLGIPGAEAVDRDEVPAEW